jgi:hypothetical protein
VETGNLEQRGIHAGQPGEQPDCRRRNSCAYWRLAGLSLVYQQPE